MKPTRSTNFCFEHKVRAKNLPHKFSQVAKGKGKAGKGSSVGRVSVCVCVKERAASAGRLEKLANRTLAQNSQDTHNFLCCFAAHPKASSCDELTSSSSSSGSSPVGCSLGLQLLGLVMRAEATPKTAAAATALGQIPEPRAAKFLAVLPRVASLLFMYLAVSLSLYVLPSLSLCCSCVYKVITQPEIKFIRRRRRLKNVFSCAFFCCAVCTNSFWGRLKGFFLPLPLPLQQLATLSAGLVQCQVWAGRSGRESYAD